MRIEEIQVENFRGIVKFYGRLNGKSAVFSGENGTGKSGIIDAIDFALSGKVRRLTGEGSKGLSLKEHATHVDKQSENSVVHLTLNLPNGERVKVRRSISKGILELIQGTEANFELLESIIGRGQYILSRRELLRFITCESGKRSEEIQELLDLSEADKIREELVASLKKNDKAVNDARVRKDSDQGNIDSILGLVLPENTWENRLNKINGLRAVLGASRIEALAVNMNVLADVAWAAQAATSQITKKTFTDGLNALSMKIPLQVVDIKTKEPFVVFQKTMEEISKFESFERAIEEVDLVLKGANLVGAENKCPLCDKPWPSEELVSYLKLKKENGKKAKDLKDEFDRLSKLFESQLKIFSQKLSVVSTALGKMTQTVFKMKIEDWTKTVNDRAASVVQIAFIGTTAKFLAEDRNTLFGYPTDFDALEKELMALADLLPEESNEEKAYKDLVAVDRSYRTYTVAAAEYERRLNAKVLIEKLGKSYELARRTVFEKLYKGIEADFSRFYRFLNAEDETAFSAELSDKGKSLEMKVDFYGRGLFPPNALHSEGHQDSMGICIFLALMKRLKAADFTISLLDDVMMSIDTSHRKKLCKLLQTEFPKTQFIITTHDKIWASQLRKAGVVIKDNVFLFRSWTVETGPVYDNKSVWEQIGEALKKNSVSEAAAALRKFLEHEFHDICGNLEAQVSYNTDHSWDLGELKASAIKQIKKYLKKAKASANKWNKAEDEAQLAAINERIDKALQEANIHEWEVNRIIHHNEWENFSANELASTVAAMKSLTEAYVCLKCHQPYSLSTPAGKYEPDAFGCVCSKFSLLDK